MSIFYDILSITQTKFIYIIKERLCDNMKSLESNSFSSEDNKKNNIIKGKTKNSIIRNRIIILLPAVLALSLLLINLSPIMVYYFNDLSNKGYVRIYLLVIFVFLLWIAARIVYNNYSSGLKTKQYLMKEIKTSRRINNELKKENEELRRLSFSDQLTGIPNRRSFTHFIETKYEKLKNRNPLMSVIMIDIDFFKQYNELLGHNEADRVIVYVAEEIYGVCNGKSNIAARFGGDEFIFASFNCDEDQIYEIAENIRSRVSKIKISNCPNKNMGNISISLGVATVRVTTPEDINKCMEFADKALYMSKSNGRNCVNKISSNSKKNETNYYVAS